LAVAFVAFIGGAAGSGTAAPQENTTIKHVAAGTLALPAALAGGRGGGIAADAAGNLYLGVTEGEESSVAVYDSSGTFLRHWLIDKRSLVLRLDDVRLAVGPEGHVYVAPQHASSPDELIKVFTPEGSPVRSFGQGSHLSEVTDIEVDSSGNVFVTSRARRGEGVPDDVVVKFDAAGQVTARFAPFPGDRGQVGNDLDGVALASDGSIFVGTDKRKTPIVHLDSAGRRLRGSDFAIALPGALNDVDDVDLAGGRLYVSGYLGEQKAPIALAVLSPEGRVQDTIAGRAHYVAVGPRVHLSGYEKATRLASHGAGNVSQYRPVPAAPGAEQTVAHADCGGGNVLDGQTSRGGSVLRVQARKAPSCLAYFAQKGSLWPGDDCEPIRGYLGGEPLEVLPLIRKNGEVLVQALPGELRSGTMILQWACYPGGILDVRYENKGEVELYDPSGVVQDSKTRKLLQAATVRLEFSPTKAGPFGTPALSLMDPQINPQLTARDGAFGWDVAPGYWRLRVTAFGFRPLRSKVYKIPPEVTGLELRLRRDAPQQARLLDPFAGRAGKVRLGSRSARTRVAGLRLKLVRGKVRRIDVRSKAYRTAVGVRLGSPVLAFKKAYASQVTPADRRATKVLTRYRIGKAFFTIRKERVAAIVLGR